MNVDVAVPDNTLATKISMKKQKCLIEYFF